MPDPEILTPPPVADPTLADLTDDEVDAHIEAGKPTDPTRLQKRIRAVTAERRDLRAQVAAHEATLLELRTKATGADGLAVERAALKEEIAKMQASHATERDLWRYGLQDDEGQQVARTLYERTPEAERPKSIGEWLSAFTAERPAPKGLAPYLAPPKGPPPPKPSGGSVAPPVAGSVTVSAIREAKEAFQRGEPGARERLQALLSTPRA